MLGIFNRMLQTSTRTHEWNPPAHWQRNDHISSYERQRCAALQQREKLARERGLFW